MKRKLNLSRLAGLVLLLAITVALIQTGSLRSAASNPNIDDLNLTSERQVLESFINDFVAYNKECAQLSKKPNLVRTEVEGLERKSEALKQRLSLLQNASRSIVSKLKAAGKWDNLNETILANTSDGRQKSFLQGINFKAEIEEAANTIGTRGKEIDVPIEKLRRRVASRSMSENENVLMLRAGYVGAVPMATTSLGCSAGKLMIGAFRAAGKTVPDIVLDFTSCACSPPCPGCNHGLTGSYDCSDLGFGAAT